MPLSPFQNPQFQEYIRSLGLGVPSVQMTQGIPQPGGAPQGGMINPLPQGTSPQQPLMAPQLPQLASMMPQGAGTQAPAGAMPFTQNAAMQQVLAPLMMSNYGNPQVSPFGQGQGGSAQIPGLGGQTQIPRPIMQGPQTQGLMRWTPDSSRSIR